MKYIKFLIIPIIVALGAFLYTFYWSKTDNSQQSDHAVSEEIPSNALTISYAVEANPSVPRVQRVGVNVSNWTCTGAEQYMRNIVKNPGFEGYVDRILVLVNHFDKNGFSTTNLVGQPNDYWKGASYEVRTGPSAGAHGVIAASQAIGNDGHPNYITEGPTPLLAANDAIVITKKSNDNPLNQWFVDDSARDSVSVADAQPRPGSPGKSSIILAPQTATPDQLNFYWDNNAEQVGKLLVVKGPWRLTFWAKGEGHEPIIRINFRRLNGSHPFLGQDVALSNEWQQYTLDFTGNDEGSPAALKLAFLNPQEQTQVFLDDVDLGPVQDSHSHTAWRQEVIAMLKELRPSFIRDRQGQHGDTLSNRLADSFARGSWMTRTNDGQGELTFGYSIPDLLDLCAHIHANPWIVLPSTFTDHELDLLGDYLAQHANKNHFSEVVLELSKGSLSSPEAYSKIADRDFDRIVSHAGPKVNIRRVIHGPYSSIDYTQHIATATKQYDKMAVAPYFFSTLNEGESENNNIQELFKSSFNEFNQINEEITPLKKSLASAEVNLHTVAGTASTKEKNRYVTSALGGAALAKHLIDGMYNKTSPQMVFAFSQFDTGTDENDGWVKLWGISRDLSPTQRWRPTGLAIKMLNHVTGGSLHKVSSKPDDALKEAQQIHLAAFRQADHWSAAAVNANDVPVVIELEFPDDKHGVPTVLQLLDAKSPFDNNEEREAVKITNRSLTPDGRKVKVLLPAYSFAVLEG